MFFLCAAWFIPIYYQTTHLLYTTRHFKFKKGGMYLVSWCKQGENMSPKNDPPPKKNSKWKRTLQKQNRKKIQKNSHKNIIHTPAFKHLSGHVKFLCNNMSVLFCTRIHCSKLLGQILFTEKAKQIVSFSTVLRFIIFGKISTCTNGDSFRYFCGYISGSLTIAGTKKIRIRVLRLDPDPYN